MAPDETVPVGGYLLARLEHAAVSMGTDVDTAASVLLATALRERISTRAGANQAPVFSLKTKKSPHCNGG